MRFHKWLNRLLHWPSKELIKEIDEEWEIYNESDDYLVDLWGEEGDHEHE